LTISKHIILCASQAIDAFNSWTKLEQLAIEIMADGSEYFDMGPNEGKVLFQMKEKYVTQD
jgi:hypothetical protein